MSKTAWFYLFMMITIAGSVAGGIVAIIYGKDVLAGVMFGYVGGGAVSMISQLGGVKAGMPVIIGAILAGLMSGCGGAKPSVDVPCAVQAAITCAAAAAKCFHVDGAGNIVDETGAIIVPAPPLEETSHE